MPPHECIHSELLNNHSLQIKELSTKSVYKEKSIMEIKDELKEINGKIDAINENVNRLILQSTKDDDKLELELTALKTQLKNLKKELDDKDEESNKRINRILVIISLVFTAITILLNVLFFLICVFFLLCNYYWLGLFIS